MRTLPFFLGTTTVPAHHWIGLSTFEITPKDSIRWSSSSTCGRRGSGTWPGVKSARGVASGLSLKINSSPRFPKAFEHH